MGYVSNAIIEMAEAGAVMADAEEVRAWRAAGHDVPLIWVEVDTYRGRRKMPAIALDVAERLAGSLEDEQAREGLRQAIEDARGCLPLRCCECGATGPRHAFVNIGHGEVACVDCA
jgi:hypothetical protein